MRSNDDASKQENYSDAIAAAAIVATVAGGAYLGYKVLKTPGKIYSKKFDINKVQKKYYDKAYNSIKKNAKKAGEDISKEELRNRAIKDMEEKIVDNKKYMSAKERQDIFRRKRDERRGNYEKLENPNIKEKISNSVLTKKENIQDKGYNLLDKLEEKLNPEYGKDSVNKQMKDKIERAGTYNMLAPQMTNKELAEVLRDAKKGEIPDIGYNDVSEIVLNEYKDRIKENPIKRNLDPENNSTDLLQELQLNPINEIAKNTENSIKNIKNHDNSEQKTFMNNALNDTINNDLFTIENGNIGLSRQALKQEYSEKLKHPNFEDINGTSANIIKEKNNKHGGTIPYPDKKR